MRRSASVCLIGWILAGCASALPGEQLADAARVRVTTDRQLARGCMFIGMASDTSETDLQRKAAWLAGDVALITTDSQEARASTAWYRSVTTAAEVYRCGGLNSRPEGDTPSSTPGLAAPLFGYFPHC